MQFSIDTIVRHKPHLQATILTLALLGFILSITRLALPGSIVSRMNVWIVVVCLKSMTILTYEILTERISRFQKWASPKANMILNCIEPVFWFAAFILSAMGISRRFQGASCGIGALLMLLALVLVPLTIGLAIVSMRERREVKSGRRFQGLRKVDGVSGEKGAMV